MFLKASGGRESRFPSSRFRTSIALSRQTKRVLIVTSSYRPVMLADMQRARMLAWELPKLGWDVEVLTPASTEVREDALEPEPAGFFPEETPIHEVGSFARGFFRAVGSRSPALRTLEPMRRRGSQLLRSARFDLIYFSTTTFSYFSLGPYWQRKFGVPYVLDFQDPWVKSDSEKLSRARWKERIAQWLFRRWEKDAVVNASGLVAVSPKYLDLLRQRYGASRPKSLDAQRNVVAPFAALPSDLQEASKSLSPVPTQQSNEIRIHYIGAGGPIMARSFLLICRALRDLRQKNHSLVNRVRICLFGTTYGWKPGDPKLLEDVARENGVADLVAEYPQRISYRRSLELLLQSDGALILGVDDSGYMPSKLFSYTLSGKPLLACLHRGSPGFFKFQQVPSLGHALWFGDDEEMSVLEASATMARFIEEAASGRHFDRSEMLRSYLASAMAQSHSKLFQSVIGE
jgi:hypothetical protein